MNHHDNSSHQVDPGQIAAPMGIEGPNVAWKVLLFRLLWNVAERAKVVQSFNAYGEKMYYTLFLVEYSEHADGEREMSVNVGTNTHVIETKLQHDFHRAPCSDTHNSP